MTDATVNGRGPRTNPRAGKPGGPAAEATPRRRMSVAERERHIVDGAIAFFAEHGLDAQMRELAGAIGVTHTLVYHYFPTKRALVDRVYEDVFAGRWKTEWETLLDDRSLDVEEKLVRFYVDYARTVLTRDFVRIMISSGLTDRSIPNRFFEMLGERLFPRLIRETRRHRGSRARGKPTQREYEMMMGLHGGIFYGGVRAFVYGPAFHAQQPPLDDEPTIRDRVRCYLAGSAGLAQGAA